MPSSVNINLPNSHNLITFSNAPKFIRGRVELDLKSNKFISSLIVKLKAVEELKFSHNFLPEKSIPLNQSLCVVENKELSKGFHKFEFVFTVDPHYTFDKQESCSITQYLKTIVNFKDNYLPLSCKLDLIFIPHPNGDGLIPFNKIVKNHIEFLGPFEVRFHANHLTVGSFIELQIKLHSPPKLLKIHCIRLKIEQRTSIHSRLNENTVEHFPIKSFNILLIGRNSPSSNIIPQEINEGYNLHGKWLARLPNDQQIRPSYIDWTMNSIKSFHKLKLEIVYTHDGHLHCANVVVPINIPHCSLAYDFVTLPQYSDHGIELTTSSKRSWQVPRTTSHEKCTCGKSISELKAIALGLNPPYDDGSNQLKYNEGLGICSDLCSIDHPFGDCISK